MSEREEAGNEEAGNKDSGGVSPPTPPPPQGGDNTQPNKPDFLWFLWRLWDYHDSLDAKCFALVWICGSTRYRHYCIDNVERVEGEGNLYRVPNYNPELWRLLGEHLPTLLGTLRGCHVYHQVLPLSRRPERGRGSASDVKVGKWLWADLDYKEPVEEPEFEGCREGKDHELECYYEEGGKWIHVKRPRLGEVLALVRERVGVDPTVVVDSGNGYHLYFELDKAYDADRVRGVEALLVDALGADKQSKDLARILRLPGSVNPRNGRLVRVIWSSDTTVKLEELEARLKRGGSEVEGRVEGRSGFRVLGDSQIIELKELLREAYRPQHRQNLVLWLSGWFAKARVHPLSTAKLIKMLHGGDNDDPLEERLSTVVYSYKKAGVDIDAFRGDIEREIGVKLPSGEGIKEEKVKGISGVQEILETAVGEERALEIIRRIEEVLETASPYRDSVIEPLRYNTRSGTLYAVANLRRFIVATAVGKDGKLIYKDKVIVGAPTVVEVYDNPLGGLTKYKVRWEAPTRGKVLEIGPTYIGDIIGRLVDEGLVLSKKLVSDVLAAVIEGFIRKGRAVIRKEIDAPGFYLVNGKLMGVRLDALVNKPGREELREALILLNELAQWFSHVVERYSLVVRWGVMAPFSYAYKQKGRWMQWLYLYGASNTGKTTLGEIILHIWGLDPDRKTGTNIDNPARLGHVLSLHTFPVLINEPGAAISKEEVVEMMKNAVENTIARGRYERGVYREIPALAPLVITSNKVLPRDDALLRRFKVLTFTYGERISEEKAEEFKFKVKPRLSKLSALGRYIAGVIDAKLLELDWEEAAVIILEGAYKEVGLEIPPWIYEEPKETGDVYEDMREAIRSFLFNKINEAYFKAAGRVDVLSDGVERSRLEVPFEERVMVVLTSKLIPWMTLKDEEVLFRADLVRELEPVIGDIGGLKSVAELLGWEYKVVKLGGVAKRVALVKLKDLIEFLNPSG